jgi:hypothetical protein
LKREGKNIDNMGKQNRQKINTERRNKPGTEDEKEKTKIRKQK